MARFAADVLVALLAVLLLARVLLWWIERRDRPRARPPLPPPGPPLSGTSVPLPASLEPHRARLEALLAPAARLEPLAARPADVARAEPGEDDAAPAQLGGAPHLPAQVAWPAAPERPLSFLAELDLAALHARAPAAAVGLPEDGLLLLFYDVEATPWGLEPDDRARFALLHVPAGAPPRAAPAGATVFPSRRLTPAPVRVLPAADELPEGRLGEDGVDDVYVEHACALWGEPDHRVRGFAGWIQSDAREEAALAEAGFPTGAPGQLEAARKHAREARPADWRLLLQLDSDPATRFEWGDGGRLYVLAREEDVRARRFDRVWLVLQCY